MTQQIKAIWGRRRFSWLDPRSVFRCFAVLQTAVLSVIIFQFPFRGQAQGNLVDLYDWSNETGYVPDPSNFIAIDSYNAAYFSSGFTTNPFGHGPLFVQPILSGSFSTTSGVTYDVSFTLQLNAPNDIFGGASMSFGDFTTNCDLESPTHGDQPGYNPPMDFSFTSVATGPATSMTFFAGFGDYTDGLSISDVMVTEVPEMSTFSMFFYGGCALLLAKHLRKVTQKQKRSTAQAA